MTLPSILVVGSVNLDLVASGAPLPRPGETVIGARLDRHPGGKGANQALALARLGGAVRLWARTGADPFADEALALLRTAGVDLSLVAQLADTHTGVALISVSPEGENQISVASGANALGLPDDLPMTIDDALLCQLECPVDLVAAAVARAQGFVALNLAPSGPVPDACLERADLVVVNALEAEALGPRTAQIRGALVITAGAGRVRMMRDGVQRAEVEPPRVRAVDTTGSGDVFAAGLLLALLEGRDDAEALNFACAAAALAATRPGAQTACPYRAEVDAFLAGVN